MKGISSSRIATFSSGLAFWPVVVFADGGISALGGMLPVFIALWAIGLGLIFWTCYSLYLLLSTPTTEIAQKGYRVYSVALLVVLLVGALIGSTFLSVLVLLAAILVAIVVGGSTLFVLSFTSKLRSDS